MNNKLKELQQQHNENFNEINQRIQSLENSSIEQHLAEVKNEYNRVVNISMNAEKVIQDIDNEFKFKTKLENKDITLLFLCTALQCARQYILSNDTLRFDDIKDDDEKIILHSNEAGDDFMRNTIGKIVKPEWNEVLFQSVPYDVIKTGKHVKDTGLSGTTHRYRTLGHDPVLGWIFGTANIMTNSATKNNFVTYQVNMNKKEIVRRYPNGCMGMLKRAAKYSKDDSKLLVASVARQAIHFGSDMFTKQGLPVPLIATVNDELAKNMLTKWNIDTWSIIKGAGLSALINNLIYCIHQLFYDETIDGSKEVYEVRTRKLLSYSNALATGSNIVVSSCIGFKKLDVGGICETLHRFVSDYRYINSIKKEFLEKEFYNTVLGKEYNFVKENTNV